MFIALPLMICVFFSPCPCITASFLYMHLPASPSPLNLSLCLSPLLSLHHSLWANLIWYISYIYISLALPPLFFIASSYLSLLASLLDSTLSHLCFPPLPLTPHQLDLSSTFNLLRAFDLRLKDQADGGYCIKEEDPGRPISVLVIA